MPAESPPAVARAAAAPRCRVLDEGVFTLATPAGTATSRGTAVIVPPFGKRVSDLLAIAHVLEANGFDVVRFDARSHVGRSTGDIERFTLGGLEDDLALVLGELEAEGPLLLVGISLSAPVALRRVARHGGVDGLLTLVGVVDVPDTIERAAGDRVGRYRAGDPAAPRLQEIFGYPILAREFVADMDARGYGGFSATLADADAVDVPIHAIAAGSDELVGFEQVARFADALPEGSTLTVIQGSSHEVSRSVAATTEALRGLARAGLRTVGVEETRPVVPPLTSFVEAAGREHAWLQELDLDDRAA